MFIAFWVLFAISICTIVVSFFMAPDSTTFSGALVGSSDLDLFKQTKEKGFKKFLKWSMYFLGFVIMIIAIIIRSIM